MSNFYELLGVDQNADQATIEAAYRRRRAEYDSDRLANAASEIRQVALQRQQELDKAYKTLSDPTLRSRYTQTLVGQPPSRRSLLTKQELLWSLAGAAAAILLLVGLWRLTSNQQPLPHLVSVEMPAPPLDLPTLDGGRVRLADFRGKVVLVNFWATWCVPCVEEAPDLARVYDKLRDQGLVIIGVNLRDSESSDETVRQFVQKYNIHYPIALDREAQAQRDYPMYPIPVTYFIDPSGTMRYIRNGTLTAAEIERTFHELRVDSPG